MEQSQEVKPINLDSIPGICNELLSIREKISEHETAVKALTARKKELEAVIAVSLENKEMGSIDVAGHKFIVNNKFSVKIPQTIEDKKAFFDFLESRGEFMEYATVNSNTLNSYYKNLLDEAVQNGADDFKVPGIGEPTTYQTISVRKK